MSLITTPISHGELLDKITILEIKAQHIADPAKLTNVRHELELLNGIWNADAAAKVDLGDARARLKAVNQQLWVIEDDIRLKERDQAFDAQFIALARAVYVTNDERAAIKREINVALGSALIEEKSYEPYKK